MDYRRGSEESGEEGEEGLFDVEVESGEPGETSEDKYEDCFCFGFFFAVN